MLAHPAAPIMYDLRFFSHTAYAQPLPRRNADSLLQRSESKQTNYISEYNDEYLDYYLKNNSIDAKTKAKLISKNYVYGYVENLPYEKKVHGKVAGIAGEYIDRVSRLADINFEYKKYDSIKDLKEAIDNKEVDVYFDYYNYGNKNYLSTVSTFVEDYVVHFFINS